MWFMNQRLVDPNKALAGRAEPIIGSWRNPVFDIDGSEIPEGSQVAYFALGCFWGAEKIFWKTPGVTNTAVGYQGGYTPNPTYQEVCTGRTGHTETVRVCFDPQVIGYDELVQIFFDHHDPTQGMRQGNDVGTQYRSAIFTTDEAQHGIALQLRDALQQRMIEAGRGEITTEISPAGPFYFAEDYHQEYLIAHPNGYDCHVRTGIACPSLQESAGSTSALFSEPKVEAVQDLRTRIQ